MKGEADMSGKKRRTILHSDMNNFYASVEIKLNPALKGIPIAVGGSEKDRHGVVLAKSQEAKALGVKTAETIWEAKRKCPELKIVRPHHDEYRKYSELAREIYYEYTNQVEPYGLDECWLDVTASENLFGSGEEIANEIKKRIRDELGLTVSIGVSFNKIFAKLGSDLKKPYAVTVINEENFKEKLWGLKVEAMLGVGRATKEKMNAIGIKTIGDLANADPEVLRTGFGLNGIRLWRFANGKDDSEVSDLKEGREAKSIGHGTTCTDDLKDGWEVYKVVQVLSQRVSKRLQEQNIKAGGVQISVRDNALKTVQFQCQLNVPTMSSIVICEETIKLFKKEYSWERPIRTVTVRAINLTDSHEKVQLSLFDDVGKTEKHEELDKIMYSIREKYGKDSIKFGSSMEDLKMPDDDDVATLNGLK